VILDVEASTEQREITWREWSKEPLSVSGIRRLLRDTGPELLGLRGVPDARVAEDLTAVELLSRPGGPETTGELRDFLRDSPRVGLNPEEIWSLQDELPYDVQVFWSGQGVAEWDYVLSRRMADGHLPRIRHNATTPAPTPTSCQSYANNPLVGTFSGKLVKQLRRFLQAQLPDYMVPTDFVLMDQLPVTTTGKINRKALPAPISIVVETEGAAVRSRTELESAIAEIWCEVLQLSSIGLNDNFLDLGGHSLLAMRVLAKVKKQFSVTADPREVMANTLAQFSALCEEKMRSIHQPRSGNLLRRITRAIAGGAK
jgi:hypothetical protein